MTLLYFGVNSVILLLVVRFFHGAAFGITSSAAATIVGDIVPKERSGEGIGYYSLSQTLATAIGPFLGMFLSQHGSYSMIFLACAIASAISLVMAPLLSLRKMEFTEEQMKEMQEFKLSNFVESGVIPISIICLLIYLCYSSIVSFLSVYAKEIHLVDAASFFFIVYAVVVLISRPAVGRWFDWKGENLIMYSATLIFAIGMFLFSHSYHGYALLLAAVLIGLGFGANTVQHPGHYRQNSSTASSRAGEFNLLHVFGHRNGNWPFAGRVYYSFHWLQRNVYVCGNYRDCMPVVILLSAWKNSKSWETCYYEKRALNDGAWRTLNEVSSGFQWGQAG